MSDQELLPQYDQGGTIDDPPSTSEGEQKQNELIENGYMDRVKEFCSTDSSPIIELAQNYIRSFGNGQGVSLNNFYKNTTKTNRIKYKWWLSKDNNRINNLKDNERRYFTEKYGENVYDTLLYYRTLGYNNMNNDNYFKDSDRYLNNINNNIHLYNNNDNNINILTKQRDDYTKKIKDATEKIDNLDINLNIEKTKFNVKGNDFVNKISSYIYVIYMIYLTVFVIILLFEDFKNTIFSYKKVLFIIFLYLVPDYIYPFVYYNILNPIFFYIYNNNFFTKPLPIKAFDDISNQKTIHELSDDGYRVDQNNNKNTETEYNNFMNDIYSRIQTL